MTRAFVLSTVTSHVSMKHKDGADEHVVDSVVNPGMSHESEQEQSDMQIDPPRDADYEPSDVFAETADESLFLKKLALFYLKLQAKLRLPSSIIQTIIKDIQEIHDTFAFQTEREAGYTWGKTVK